jgi:hypothetical protein
MIEMKAVLAGAVAKEQLKAVQDEWEKALKAQAKANKADYDKTHATWDTDVQVNIGNVHKGRDRWYVDTWIKNRIYWFVHESVSVMRGVLSPDWSPKTKPRVLGSGAGSGRLLYASKKVSKPPYEARKFTETIIKVQQPEFQKRMERATDIGARKAARQAQRGG